MSLFPAALQPALDSNGDTISGATWNFYATGGTTPAAVYSDVDLTTSLGAVVTADAAGRFANIYLSNSILYRAVLKDASGTTLKDIDPANARVYFSNYFVTPEEYGAVGDGTTDDSTAFTTLWAADAGRLVLGGGLTYKFATGTSVPAGFKMLDGAIDHADTVAINDDYAVLALGEEVLEANTFIPEQHPSSGPDYASGNHIVALGYQAMKNSTIARRMVAVGSRALLSNTTGAYNTALGSHAMENNTTGIENTAVGVQSLGSCSTGNRNSMLGVGAGNKITTGSDNIGIGNSSMSGIGTAACTGTYNIGIGYQSLGQMTSGLDNIAMGRLSLQIATTAEGNVAIGTQSLQLQETGGFNVAVGYQTLIKSTVASNVAVGAEAMVDATTATTSVAVGRQAGTNVTTADSGVYIGYRAGLNLTTGGTNTIVGALTGATLTTGSTNVLVGYATDVSAAGALNQNSIGYGAACTGDDQMTLGNASIATLRCQQTSITALSDQRFKTATKKGFSDGLAFINDVKVRDFKWNKKAKGQTGRRELGIFAQELDKAAKDHGLEWLGLVDHTNPDRLEATPGKLLFPLIQAVQQLAEKNADLEARLAVLEAR